MCTSLCHVSVSRTSTRTISGIETRNRYDVPRDFAWSTYEGGREISLLDSSVRSSFRRIGRKMSYEKENKRSLFPFGGTWCRYIPRDRASRNSHIRPRVNSGGFRVDTWRSLWVHTKMDFEYRMAACIAALLLFRFFLYFFSSSWSWSLLLLVLGQLRKLWQLVLISADQIRASSQFITSLHDCCTFQYPLSFYWIAALDHFPLYSLSRWYNNSCEVWGSHGGVDEESSVLGRGATSNGKFFVTTSQHGVIQQKTWIFITITIFL